jgi:tetratricopeptide (TPR) repeat protein
MSGDLTQMGDVLREAGRPKEALAKYGEALTVMNTAKVPEEIREATRRTHVFEEGRVAAAANDLATAKAKLAEYTRQVAPKQRPFEVRQQHELAGMIALAEKKYRDAVRELGLANQQDPRILYLTAVAMKAAGESQRAIEYAGKAAKFNGLNFNYAYVRTPARKLAGT